jgi:glycolate oxidase FAD binding subunit
MSAGQNSAAQVTGAAYLPPEVLDAFPDLPPGEAIALLRLEGVAPSLPSRRALLADVLAPFGGRVGTLAEAPSRRIWRAIADAAPFTDPARPLWRINLPPSAAPGVVERLGVSETVGPQRGFLDWGGGLIWLEAERGAPAQAAAIRAAVADIPGANAILLRGEPALRAAVAPMQPLEAGLMALTRRVKAQFDPHGLFNPGRLYEGV